MLVNLDVSDELKMILIKSVLQLSEEAKFIRQSNRGLFYDETETYLENKLAKLNSDHADIYTLNEWMKKSEIDNTRQKEKSLLWPAALISNLDIHLRENGLINTAPH